MYKYVFYLILDKYVCIMYNENVIKIGCIFPGYAENA